MKLLKLEIHNIASIIHSTIDFEHSILAREPLFLICGETGSGKSTILNCICMALYNRVPGMPNSHDSYDGETIGNLNNFLRKGTGEGYIHLFFEEAEKRYEADWSIRRARNNPNGKLQNVERLLTDTARELTLATKKDEVNKYIQDIIGLDFDRFTRMFMLAQGQFNKFLTADEKEKSAILELLTRMDVYNRIGKYIHDKKTGEEDLLKKMRQQLEDIHLLTPEELTEKKRQLEESDTETKKLIQEISAIDKKISWRQSVEKDSTSLNDLETHRTALSRQAESDEYRKRQESIKLWDETVELRQCLTDIVKTENANIQCEKALNECRPLFEKHFSALERAKQELAERKQELDEKEKLWTRLKTDSVIFENKQTIDAGLSAISQYEKNNTNLSSTIETLKKQISEANTDLCQTKQNLDTATAEYEKMTVERDKRQKEIGEAGKETLQSQRNQLATDIADIERAKSKWQSAFLANNTYNETNRKLQKQQEELDTLRQEYRKAMELLKSAEEVYARQQQLFDTKKLTIDDCAKELRKSLEEGKPCPICGSKHHDVQPEHVFDSLYEQAKGERDKAAKKREECQNALTAIRTSAELKVKEQKQIQETLAQLTAQQETANNEWQIYAKKYIFNAPFDTCKQLLEDNKKKKNDLITDIDKRLKEIKKLEDALQMFLKQFETAGKSLQALKDSYKEKENQLKRIETEIAHYTAQIENNKKAIEAQVNAIDKLMTWADWQQLWRRDKVAFDKKLSTETASYNDCKQNIPLLTNKVSVIEGNVGSSESSIQYITDLFPIWTDRIVPDKETVYQSNLSELLSGFVAKIKEFVNQRQNYENTIVRLTEQKGILIETYQTSHLGKELDKSQMDLLTTIDGNTILGYRKDIETLTTDIAQTKGKIDQLKEELKRLNEQIDKPSEEETIDKLRRDKEAEENAKGETQRKVGSLMEQINNNAANAASHQKLLEERERQNDIFNRWATLDNMFGVDRFSKAAQQMTFRFLLGKANQHLSNLYPRYKLLCAPDSFVLAIEDREMGTTRPCTTLSGGESFIVSLALALGLSSLSDEKIKVETLFIDEGFGTLSSEYLDTVMKVLENLQRTGRKVGIISHVDILRERIPAQIQVIRKSRTESEIEVVG